MTRKHVVIALFVLLGLLFVFGLGAGFTQPDERFDPEDHGWLDGIMGRFGGSLERPLSATVARGGKATITIPAARASARRIEIVLTRGVSLKVDYEPGSGREAGFTRRLGGGEPRNLEWVVRPDGATLTLSEAAPGESSQTCAVEVR